MGSVADSMAIHRTQVARLVAATAANLAGWHELMLRALGHETRHEAGFWLTSEHVPLIFFSGIAVRPGASSATCAAGTSPTSWIAVCDPWSDVELASAAFSVEGDHPWMVRPPRGRDDEKAGRADDEVGRVDGNTGDAPDEALRVERVVDADGLADFEVASAIGFGSQPQPPFTWHAPSVLADPRLFVWRGKLDGRTVSTSMGFVEAGVVGVYGVSTVPSARRRGFAKALTLAALSADPSLPSVLQPSPTAEPLYQQLGYRRFTTFRTWVRAAGSPNERSTP